jgi:hypothetical protein
MHRFLFALTMLWALPAPAQQTVVATVQQAAGSNWQRVQALPAGTSIQVKARKSHANCKLKSVDDDSLTCTQKKDLVFERTDILAIKVPHRGRSTLVGLAAGGATGALIGVAAGTSGCTPGPPGNIFGNLCLNIVSRGDLAAIGGVSLGAVGAIIGGLTDFTRSTVYKAP